MEDENYKRKGLMSEAVKAIMDYGFNVLNLHRIEAIVGAGNVPSLKLMAKNRFKQEGVLRVHFWVGDKYEDSLMFSILRAKYYP